MAHVRPSCVLVYLFGTHVPAHAVLLAPEAAALHVLRSAGAAGQRNLQTGYPLRQRGSRLSQLISWLIQVGIPIQLLRPV